MTIAAFTTAIGVVKRIGSTWAPKICHVASTTEIDTSRIAITWIWRRRLRAAAAARACACSALVSAGASPDAASVVDCIAMSGRLGRASAGGAQLVPDMGAQRRVARVGAHRIDVAGAAEREVDDLLDLPRPRAHHGDAVAEHDRLVDRMGDEHDGLALVRPLHQVQQLLLQGLAGLRIERGEW